MSSLNRKEVLHSSHKTLLMDAMQIIKGMEKMRLRFCNREINSVADFLAKLGSNMQTEEEFFFS